MTEKSYDIKILLERRAKAALIECRQTLKAVSRPAGNNSDFIDSFAAGKITDNCFHNSLTCQIIDKNTSVLFQTGLHFVLAAKVGKDIFVNQFAFGNRTVTERERFKKYKHVKFIDGTIKAAALEKLLYNCKDLEEAEKVANSYKFLTPDISKGVKVYLAKCIAEANK